MKIHVRKPFHRERLTIVNDEPSMTHESHAASCDINNIVSQFHRTGQMPPGRTDPQYGDVTGLQVDLTEAHQRSVETLKTAKEFDKTYVPKSKRQKKPKDESDDTLGKNPAPLSAETEKPKS